MMITFLVNNIVKKYNKEDKHIVDMIHRLNIQLFKFIDKDGEIDY
jgi:hypothetical protein